MIQFLLQIQQFFSKFFQTIASLLKVLLMSKKIKTLKKQTGKELVILGNGPSLQNFLTHHIHFLNSKQSLAVNHFANFEIFTQIKPKYYIINVPEFWTNNVDTDVVERKNKLIKDIVEKTNWKMHLILGIGAKKSKDWMQIGQQNKEIDISFINPTPIEGFTWFKHFCYWKYCGMPRPHNVLIPSLITGINLQFSKIYITGADHNWMQELFVADDNTVYLTQKHFYDAQTAKPDVMKKTGKGKRKMHEILIKFVHSFKGYFDIDTYAKSKNTSIINITPKSFIDAFTRFHL
jgi:hypothetical protein